MVKQRIFPLVLMVLLFYCRLNGQSIFSFSEQGGPLLTGNSHMSALGYADIPCTFSSNLRGSIAFLKNTNIDVTYTGTRLDMKDESGKNIAYYYGFPFFKFGSTLPANLVIGVELRKRMDYNANFVTATDSINGAVFDGKFLKNGELRTGTAEISKKFGNNFGIGAGVNILFGGSNEVWITNFSDTLFRDTQDSLRTNYFGYSYSLGIVCTKSWFNLGLGYDFPITCDKVTRSLSYYRKDTTVSNDELVFPSNVTGAINLSFSKNLNLLVTLRYSNWDNFKYNNIINDEYLNVFSYSFGLEYKREEEYEQRLLPIRLGYFSNPWYFRDSNGERVQENGITAGTSIPILRRGGSLDISFCGGMRETSQLQEFFYKVNFGFNFRERW